jgi:hypothetical protein
MTTQEQKEREQGLSLLDIGPLYELVPAPNGKKLRVYGVSAKGIFAVFQRFPEVGSWFKGGKKVDMAPLIAEAPDAIAAVIAAGCGKPGDMQAEEVAGLLPVETQLDVLEAIGRLTFKNGFGPFVQRIVALSEQAQSLNFGRGLAMRSPPASKPASVPASTPISSGI